MSSSFLLPPGWPSLSNSGADSPSSLTLSKPPLFAASASSRARLSCRAFSSSMLMRRASANSGSVDGSTPNGKSSLAPPAASPPAAPALAAAPSPSRIGDEMSWSLSSLELGGMTTRCDDSVVPLISRLNVSSFAWFSSSMSPNSTKSTLMENFFIFLARVTSSRSPSSMGEQTKTMMRARWDLFCRCLSASCREATG